MINWTSVQCNHQPPLTTADLPGTGPTAEQCRGSKTAPPTKNVQLRARLMAGSNTIDYATKLCKFLYLLRKKPGPRPRRGSWENELYWSTCFGYAGRSGCAGARTPCCCIVFRTSPERFPLVAPRVILREVQNLDFGGNLLSRIEQWNWDCRAPELSPGRVRVECLNIQSITERRVDASDFPILGSSRHCQVRSKASLHNKERAFKILHTTHINYTTHGCGEPV